MPDKVKYQMDFTLARRKYHNHSVRPSKAFHKYISLFNSKGTISAWFMLKAHRPPPPPASPSPSGGIAIIILQGHASHVSIHKALSHLCHNYHHPKVRRVCVCALTATSVSYHTQTVNTNTMTPPLIYVHLLVILYTDS